MKKVHVSILLGLVAMFAFSVSTPQSAGAATSAAQQQNKANATSNKQTPGEYIDDSLVTAAVKTKILEEKGLSSMQISVITKDGVVTLSGTADTTEHVMLAERVTKMVKGVKQVVNKLQVEGAKKQSAGEYIDDAAITTSVKSKILAEKGLSSMQISATTKDGVVTLTGTTDTPEQAKLAEAVAKQTNGVKQVVNNLRTGK